ncbi:MAG: hypothetical protein HYR63_10435 [Proteobacteria bacterium]|nr:hypothetical protein [Pseudomonadota bacterium]
MLAALGGGWLAYRAAMSAIQAEDRRRFSERVQTVKTLGMILRAETFKLFKAVDSAVRVWEQEAAKITAQAGGQLADLPLLNVPRLPKLTTGELAKVGELAAFMYFEVIRLSDDLRALVGEANEVSRGGHWPSCRRWQKICARPWIWF